MMQEVITDAVTGEVTVRDMTTEEIAAIEARQVTEERATMVCSRFQAKAAMMQAGLLDAVEAEIANASAFAKLAWAEAVEYRRDSPLINSLAASIGLTDAQIDDLFRAAMVIKA